jgi:nitroreductase
MAIIDPILQRRSVREYREDPVADKDIEEIIKAGQFAPTAVNNRSIEFLVIKNEETRKALYDLIEPKQDFIKSAPVLIIPVISAKRSVLPVQDLSVASENIFIQAAAMGLGTVWRNIDPRIAEKMKNYLKIPEEYVLINLIPLGYAEKEPERHADKDFSGEKIHYEIW